MKYQIDSYFLNEFKEKLKLYLKISKHTNFYQEIINILQRPSNYKLFKANYGVTSMGWTIHARANGV